jgi:hypothetical protein
MIGIIPKRKALSNEPLLAPEITHLPQDFREINMLPLIYCLSLWA